MKKHLFLTGPSGIGKTTLLREELGWMLQTAGGLATVRECDSVLGYDLLPAAALGGVEGYTPLRFLDYSVDPPVRDNEVFRSEGVRLLNEAPYYSFALLDEIGGYELLIPEFRHALEELLNSETPIIGVLKGRENAAALIYEKAQDKGFISVEEFQIQSGVPKSVVETLDRNGAFGDMPKQNQITLF